MWIRTEQGAINLTYVTNIAVHESKNEESGESWWVVCAEMADARHITVKVYSDYDQARVAGDELCDGLVAREAGRSTAITYNGVDGRSEVSEIGSATT